MLGDGVGAFQQLAVGLRHDQKSWKRTRVTSAPSTPPETTSMKEWMPASILVCATSRAMMNVSDETRNQCVESPRMYVAAIQPAKATAAWPDGSPPRSGRPRPVYALTAITR